MTNTDETSLQTILSTTTYKLVTKFLKMKEQDGPAEVIREGEGGGEMRESQSGKGKEKLANPGKSPTHKEGRKSKQSLHQQTVVKRKWGGKVLGRLQGEGNDNRTQIPLSGSGS